MIGALIVFLVIVGGVYGFVNIVTLGDAHKSLMRHRPAALRSRVGRLSWPSRQVLREFNALPVDSQRGIDLLPIVEALDIKYGRDKLDQHFLDTIWKQYGWKKSGDYDCRYQGHRGRYCIGNEHLELRKKIDGIKQSLAEQDAAARLLSIAGDMDALAAVHQRLKEEREILDKTTKEMK